MSKTEFYAKVRITGEQARITIPKEQWAEMHNLKDGDLCRFTIQKAKKKKTLENK